jgi:hypothetical protein
LLAQQFCQYARYTIIGRMNGCNLLARRIIKATIAVCTGFVERRYREWGDYTGHLADQHAAKQAYILDPDES